MRIGAGNIRGLHMVYPGILGTAGANNLWGFKCSKCPAIQGIVQTSPEGMSRMVPAWHVNSTEPQPTHEDRLQNRQYHNIFEALQTVCDEK